MYSRMRTKLKCKLLFFCFKQIMFHNHQHMTLWTSHSFLTLPLVSETQDFLGFSHTFLDNPSQFSQNLNPKAFFSYTFSLILGAFLSMLLLTLTVIRYQNKWKTFIKKMTLESQKQYER